MTDEGRDTYQIVGPEGNRIAIPKELFMALSDFLLEQDGPSGAVVIHFRNGGVAGLEALVRKTYK